MSTNYYCRNRKEYQEWIVKEKWLDAIIQKAIDQLEVLDLQEWVINSIVDKIKYEYVEQSDFHKFEEFHIGKRSRQQFKLEVQPYYAANINSLMKWLLSNNGEYEIVDEYGETITVEDFKQIVLDCENGQKWLNYSFS